LRYTSIQANYLTIPVYILSCITLVIGTTISDRIKLRHPVLLIAPLPVIIGYILACATSNAAAGYFAMFLCGAGIYTFNCTLLTWVSNNLAPDYKRSVGVPLFVSLGNISGVVASNIYPSTGGPRYLSGNAVSAVMETLAWFGVLLIWWLLRKRNAAKEKMIAEGVEDNEKEGDRALGFKYNL
jgi:predicted MFS family arabinose efflux permease